MKTHVNLMPWKSRRKSLLHLHAARWTRVAAMVGVMTSVCLWVWSDDLAEAKSRLTQLDERAEIYRDQIDRNDQVQQKINRLERRHALFDELAPPHQPLQIVGIVSAGSREQHGVSVASFRISPVAQEASKIVASRRESTAAVNASNTEQTRQRTELLLTGVAQDDLALSRFIETLRMNGVFTDVELKSSREVTRNERPVREYELRCAF